jgi:hypothetical protein
MARLAGTRALRIGCWTVVGCGVLESTFFSNYYPYSSSFYSNVQRLQVFGWDILPFVIVALAMVLGRTFPLAVLCLVASIWILGLSLSMHLEYMQRNALNGWINDYSLFIVPSEWTIATVALAATAAYSLWRKLVAAWRD